jgi:hypothetical protein
VQNFGSALGIQHQASDEHHRGWAAPGQPQVIGSQSRSLWPPKCAFPPPVELIISALQPQNLDDFPSSAHSPPGSHSGAFPCSTFHTISGSFGNEGYCSPLAAELLAAGASAIPRSAEAISMTPRLSRQPPWSSQQSPRMSQEPPLSPSRSPCSSL